MSERFISRKKYELVEDDFIETLGERLFRIRALIDFGKVKAGELGGYIEKEANLSQHDDAWVRTEARVYGNAQVWGDGRVSEYARVSGNAQVSGYAHIFGYAHISDWARVSGGARVKDYTWVKDDARVFGDACISSHAKVSGDAQVFGDVYLSDRMHLSGHAWVSSNEDVLWLADIDRECSSLTAYRTQSGVELTHHYFYGSPEAFLEKMVKKYGDSRTAREYQLLIEFAQSRLQADDCLQEAAV